jgi:hypothetical protein
VAERTTPPAKPAPKPKGPRRTAEVIPPARTTGVVVAKQRGGGRGRVKVAQSEDSIERDAEAMRLRTLGWTREQIAGHLHMAPATVTIAISRHVGRVLDEPARDIREQMLARLDAAVNAAMVVLTSVHYVFHQGDQLTMVDPETNQPLPVKDHGPILAAAKVVADLDARRAKLLGIDAPERQEVSITQLPSFVEELVKTKRAEALGEEL